MDAHREPIGYSIFRRGRRDNDPTHQIDYHIYHARGAKRGTLYVDLSPDYQTRMAEVTRVATLLSGDLGGRLMPNFVHAVLRYLSADYSSVVSRPDYALRVESFGMLVQVGSSSGKVLEWSTQDLFYEREKLMAVGSLHNVPDGSRGSGKITLNLADVVPTEVQWLWPKRFPLGRITLLVGRPGEGKSFFTCFLAARVTRGGHWPDAPDAQPAEPRDVLFICCEDNPSDTLRPRLDACGADVSRVHLLGEVPVYDQSLGRYVNAPYNLCDIQTLEAVVAANPNIGLIVIDPIGSYLGGGVDAYRDNDVRAILSPVAAFAEKHNIAVLIVAHRRKGTGGFADDSAMGSRAFTGVARCVYHLLRDTQAEQCRLVLSGKNNLSPRAPGLRFTFDGVGSDTQIRLLDSDLRMGADEGMAAEAGMFEGADGRQNDNATDWLTAQLRDGPVSAADLTKAATAAGFTDSQLRRAAQRLNVERRKGGFGAGWTWSLSAPAEGAKASI